MNLPWWLRQESMVVGRRVYYRYSTCRREQRPRADQSKRGAGSAGSVPKVCVISALDMSETIDTDLALFSSTSLDQTIVYPWILLTPTMDRPEVQEW